MWKKIGLVFLGLVIGCIIGIFFATAYFGKPFASATILIQQKELIDFETAADDAYYNEPNEVAIWALTKYLETLNNTKEWLDSAKVKESIFYSDPNRAFFVAYARLCKIYNRMGNEEKSHYYFEKAKTHRNGKSFTKEDLLKSLDEIDKSHYK